MYLYTDECSLRKKNENGWVPSVALHNGGHATWPLTWYPDVNFYFNPLCLFPCVGWSYGIDDKCSDDKCSRVCVFGGGLITLYAVSQIPFVNIIETILFADIHTQNDFFPCLTLCILGDGILVATSWHIMSVCLSPLLFCESHLIVMYILTPFANSFIGKTVSVDMSVMQMVNGTGPSIFPWGIPLSTSDQLEDDLFKRNLCRLFN